jgi:hypothetical protein
MTETLVWQKSSFSEDGDAPNCLELTARQGALLLRESEEPGRVIAVTAAGLGGLIRRLQGA